MRQGHEKKLETLDREAQLCDYLCFPTVLYVSSSSHELIQPHERFSEGARSLIPFPVLMGASRAMMTSECGKL
jgi:hypothetical protein